MLKVDSAKKISWMLDKHGFGGSPSYTFEGLDDDLIAARIVLPEQLPGPRYPAHKKFKHALLNDDGTMRKNGVPDTPWMCSRLANGLVRVRIHAKTVESIIATDEPFKRFMGRVLQLD